LHHLSCPPEIYRLKSWHFKIGDRLHCHDVIATVETDSLTWRIPVNYEGVLAELFFEEGDSIPDGATIARLDLIEMTKPGGEDAEGG
jgi:pyruvate/2-oxoglutarate dehydrogenase complex dihydrolipoamide acyltransferase (E2) component